MSSLKMRLPALRAWLKERRKPLLWVSLGLLAALLLREHIKDIIVISVLSAIAVFSTIYKRFMRVPPAAELITFSTVMVGLGYGPVVGAIYGAVITLVAEIVNSGIDAFIVGYVPARAVVGAAAAFFPETSIVTLGVMMSLLYNAVAQPLYAFQSDAELRAKLLLFVLLNVPFNFLAFSLLGGIAKSIIL